MLSPERKTSTMLEKNLCINLLTNFDFTKFNGLLSVL